MSNSASLIEKAWVLRTARDLEGFFEVLMELQKQFPLADFELASAATIKAKKLDFEIWAQICLLQVAFLRSQNLFSRAELIFANLEKVGVALHQPLPPRFFMERGLNALVVSNHFFALENFIKIQDDRKLGLQARINVLICLEYLHLVYEKAAESFAKDIKRKTVSASIQNQWDAFKLRHSFRMGDFFAIKKSKPNKTSQGMYYKSWCLSLPYQNLDTASTKTDDFFAKTSSLFLASYRLRTLAGLGHPDDNSVTMVSERIERIYLWTWRWLAAPDGYSLQKVARQIEDLRGEISPHKLGFHDLLLLRNALGWIGLFDSSSESEFHQFLSRYDFGKDRSLDKLLEFEYLVISYFRACRDQDHASATDFRKLMKSTSLWMNPHILFRSLVDASAKDGDRLALLRQNLSRLIESRKPKSNAKLVVDLDRFQISKEDGTKIYSEVAARALWLLRSKKSVAPDDFIDFVFSIRPYDSYVHASKINNLLARIRKLMPKNLSFSFRNARVMVEGSWEDVHFLGTYSFENQIKNLVSFKLKKTPLSKVHKNSEISSELASFGSRPFRRSELELKLKKSRATVNRLLEQWIHQGILRTEGRARSTRYVYQTEEK